ncbi:MAG: pseudouridine synthase [Ignavibacteriales bacterium]|nr:pseudouridine synthase [Ignavibacteriales bacterium]
MKTSRAAGRVTLPRALSKLGIASRTQALGLIEKGLVSVNGKIEVNPHRWVDMSGDRIELENQLVKRKSFRYLALHKPPGFVTTRSDERGQETVFDLLGESGEGLSAIGRLDKDSSGLLLFTNDHQLANMLTSPESDIQKKYYVCLDRPIGRKELILITDGIDLRIEGHPHHTKPAQASQLSPGILEFSITEGKNRQIRRMMESIGYEVMSLKRISVGSLQLGGLREGEFRDLSAEEVQLLRTGLRRSNPAEHKREPALRRSNPAEYKRKPGHRRSNSAEHKRKPGLRRSNPAEHEREPRLRRSNPADHKRKPGPGKRRG